LGVGQSNLTVAVLKRKLLLENVLFRSLLIVAIDGGGVCTEGLGGCRDAFSFFFQAAPALRVWRPALFCNGRRLPSAGFASVWLLRYFQIRRRLPVSYRLLPQLAKSYEQNEQGASALKHSCTLVFPWRISFIIHRQMDLIPVT
jgi:hypothetical protein